MIKTWSVTLPIAGHAVVTVEAGDEETAIAEAFNIVTLADVEVWEALEQFNQGNICYCPQPWEAEAIDETPGTEVAAMRLIRKLFRRKKPSLYSKCLALHMAQAADRGIAR